MHRLLFLTIFAFSLSIFPAPALEDAKPILLWPGTAPGEKGDIGPEHDGTKPEHEKIAGKIIVRLANVSQPSLTVYRPPAEKETGCAVIICPGGAYQMLAYDLEGTEVAEWLNSIGVTAVLLKYRVPRRANLEKHAAPLQDAQRALSLVRHRAQEWNIDPKRLGILGFSAGGHLAATTSNIRERTYVSLDEADKTDLLPNFTILVYPAYLTPDKDLTKLAPEIAVSSLTPPAFLVHAQDDPISVVNSFLYAQALHQNKVKTELHVYPFGKHGYGLRKTAQPVTEWPERATAWMSQMGWLKPKGK